MSYRKDVQPIVERRCVVCHGCYDAPCQLKLTAWEGVARGSSQKPVYDAARLLEAPTTRLFVDAQLPSQWRQRFFRSIERKDADLPSQPCRERFIPLACPQARSSATGFAAAFQCVRRIAGARLDVSAHRPVRCLRSKNPLAGMPYGLPGLDEREFSTITRWIEAGAPFEGDEAVPVNVQQQVQVWEAFLNGDSNKERLMSRYLYEHLYLGHLYFETDSQRRAFRIVRSTTPSGKPIAPIATRRPYDDPGVARFFYRLEPEREALRKDAHALCAQRGTHGEVP